MRYKPYIQTLFLSSLTLILVICMIRFPQIAFDSALRGLKIWWEIVFPATLPFMILSEMMVGFGVVHFLGVLLEPLMRPLFNVPGAGGFVMAMGLSSGYPVGPKLATRLREQKLVSRSEGERLVCFTSTSDPLFIFGAVAVGFFHDASLGVNIAIANYAGAILIGLLLRLHEPKASITAASERNKSLPLFLRALQAMHRARLKDRRPMGRLMGDAVWSSFQTLFVIGGFIIIFSVIIKFVSMGSIARLLTVPLSLLLQAFHIPADMSQAFVIGFFEVTQSMQHISGLEDSIAMATKIAIASALVAWGGISVHAQVASIISGTDMRYKPYFFWKFLHALFAGLISFLLWIPLKSQSFAPSALPAFAQKVPSAGLDLAWGLFLDLFLYSLLCLLILAAASVLLLAFKKIAYLVR